MSARTCTKRVAAAALALVLTTAAVPMMAAAQAAAPGEGQAATASAVVRGQVTDPSGAVVPGATVLLLDTAGKTAGRATSDAGGVYLVRGLAPGTYSIMVTAPGFGAYAKPGIVVTAGQVKNVNPSMAIAVEKQEVQVQAQSTTIDTSPDSNANSIVIKGDDLNSLSDDPDELSNELQALAGPSAGPNGGEIYIDGFSGGQLPPKSSIREVRVNQNPFSAQYDRLGYGRIEILTKPGTDKLHGQIEARGNDSPFNSKNPILQNAPQPPYYSWDLHGAVGGPLSKSASYFVSIFGRDQQAQAILEAIQPTSVTAGNPNGTPVNAAIPNPRSRLDISPRVDLQLGGANTLTIREDFSRSVSTNGGLGTYSLQEQAINTHSLDNTLQLSDSLILSNHLVDDIRFQYRRIRSEQDAQSSLPSYSVQQRFTAGGNNSQTVADHENTYELQNYFSGAFGSHSLGFGGRLRAYQDTNYSTAGTNGSYVFSSLAPPGGGQPDNSYLSRNPRQYNYTLVHNPTVRSILFDAALYYQDDWKVNSRLTFSYGLRWESQNRINDKSDWAPRLAVAYALGKASGHQQPKTVVRAGYGWFYQRFTVANTFGGSSAPYLTTVIRNSPDKKHAESLVLTNPGFFEQNTVTPITSGTASGGRNAPSYYYIDPHFKAANDMEAAVGVDRQITKAMTGNVTYIFSQGVHQYLTNNLGAAGLFDDAAADQGIYPSDPIGEPTQNLMTFQSGGFYKEHQVMVTLTARYRRFSIMTNYSFSNAKGDTSGATYVPSVAGNPGLDYGRTSFDIRHRYMIFGNFMLPYAVSASPFLVANSGTPYSITTGTDLTGNNQFNARPTYAASCDEANVVQTQFGCLNTNPFGTNEKIVPVGLGTGPVNVSLNMRLSKVIGIGPKVERGAGPGGGGPHGGPGGLRGGFSGSRGGPGRLDAAVSRRYSLTFSAFATNILNHQNLGTPNGALDAFTDPTTGKLLPSTFFGTSQSLSGGFFGPSTSGNRSIFLQSVFSF